MKKLLGTFSAIAVMLLACNSARATLFTVGVTAADGSTSQQVLASNNVGTITTLPDGVTQEWKATVNQAGSYNLQFDLLLDPDPSISGSVALTNAAGSTQTFTLNVSQSIASTPAGSAIFGSSSISIGDANFDSASTVGAPTGSAIYTAFINSNVSQKTLFAAPYTLSKNGVPGGTAVDSQTYPPPIATTTAAATTMGIQHSFTLTAGDSATMNSTFTITVPEPCTLVLAGLGALGLAAVRFGRRK